MNHVKMFQSRFAGLVKDGQKNQTVRPVPKREIKAGDSISLRQWSGLPYRSKQIVLRDSKVIEVVPVEIMEGGVAVSDFIVPYEDFARADGFKDFKEMVAWFKQTHGLPFTGILIKWK